MLTVTTEAHHLASSRFSDYQPAGNASVFAAALYAATRVSGGRFTNLRLILSGEVYSGTFGVGAFNIAKASRGELTKGASANAAVGTIVGWLVSMIIRSGHRWVDLMRTIELSYRASRTKFEEWESCQYRSATNNIPRSRLPVNKKYRPTGT